MYMVLTLKCFFSFKLNDRQKYAGYIVFEDICVFISEVKEFEFYEPNLKKNIGWPLTEKVLKFNMSFNDSVIFFQNIKIK